MRFLSGRNGADALFYGCATLYIILYGLNMLIVSPALHWANLVLVFLTIYRLLSTNIKQRKKENEAFKKIIFFIMPFLRHADKRVLEGKDFYFNECPSCGVTIKTQKKRGKFQITCPKCKHKFIVKHRF